MFRKLIVFLIVGAAIFGLYVFSKGGIELDTPLGTFTPSGGVTILSVFGLGFVLGLVIRG